MVMYVCHLLKLSLMLHVDLIGVQVLFPGRMLEALDPFTCLICVVMVLSLDWPTVPQQWVEPVATMRILE